MPEVPASQLKLLVEQIACLQEQFVALTQWSEQEQFAALTQWSEQDCPSQTKERFHWKTCSALPSTDS